MMLNIYSVVGWIIPLSAGLCVGWFLGNTMLGGVYAFGFVLFLRTLDGHLHSRLDNSIGDDFKRFTTADARSVTRARHVYEVNEWPSSLSLQEDNDEYLLVSNTTLSEDTSSSTTYEMSEDMLCHINPATGLPMINGCGGLDVAGNPYGTDLQDHFTDTCITDDTFNNSLMSDTDWSSSSDDGWNH